SVELSPDKRPGEVTLRLGKEQMIRGRVLSTEGKPVAGASVKLTGGFAGKGGSLDGFLTAWKSEWQLAFQRADRWFHLPQGGPLRATTDKDGRFQLSGLGAERVSLLEVSGPGIARGKLHVIGRRGFDPKPYNEAALGRVPAEFRAHERTPLLYGPSFDYIA